MSQDMTFPSTWHLAADMKHVSRGSVHVYRVGPGKPFTRRQARRLLRRMADNHRNARPLSIDGHEYHRRTRARRKR